MTTTAKELRRAESRLKAQSKLFYALLDEDRQLGERIIKARRELHEAEKAYNRQYQRAEKAAEMAEN